MDRNPRSGPKLSILIPTYNWDVRRLIAELQLEIFGAGLEHEVELRVFDDGSAPPFRDQLRLWWSNERKFDWNSVLLDLGRNVGRAEARNRLIAASTADYLLFLDADVLPDRPDFIRRYLSRLDAGPEVIVGGLSQRRVGTIAREEAFYVRYFQAACCLSVEQRQARAWQNLYTANVVVSRRLVQICPLTPDFHGYGYEDVEWALRLSHLTEIRHIDNTVTHCGLLGRSVLWRKQREAAANAGVLWRLHPQVIGDMVLLRWATRIRHLPSWTLRAAAKLSSHVFLQFASYRLCYAALQIDKLCSTALVLKRSGISQS